MIRIVDKFGRPVTGRHNYPQLVALEPLMVLERKSTERVKLKATDLGNGHLEVVGSRETQWVELDPALWPLSRIMGDLEWKARQDEKNAEEIAQRLLERAAKRAKKNVRQLCKSIGANTLLTLTYHFNERDIARCKADLKEFNRRMLRLIPHFRFVAGFEQQDRGAWHVHMATEKLPIELLAKNGVKVKSFNVIRAVWRSVTKERAGNVDIQASKRRTQRTPARIASYIAKYIAKAFAEGVAGSNRWTKYGKFDEISKPVDMGVYPSMLEAMRDGWALVPDNATADIFRMDKWKDWFVLYVEGPVKLTG